jgi:hypothetical protein
MCSPFVRKEANRFYWIVKGQLIPESWSDKDVEKIYDSYMKRIWGNHEAVVHETGFHQAWLKRQAEQYNRDIEKVAVLGYN